MLPPQRLAVLRPQQADASALLPLEGWYVPDLLDAPESPNVYAERLGISDELGMPSHPGSAAELLAVVEEVGIRCHMATQRIRSGDGSTDNGDCSGGEGE